MRPDPCHLVALSSLGTCPLSEPGFLPPPGAGLPIHPMERQSWKKMLRQPIARNAAHRPATEFRNKKSFCRQSLQARTHGQETAPNNWNRNHVSWANESVPVQSSNGQLACLAKAEKTLCDNMWQLPLPFLQGAFMSSQLTYLPQHRTEVRRKTRKAFKQTGSLSALTRFTHRCSSWGICCLLSAGYGLGKANCLKANWKHSEHLANGTTGLLLHQDFLTLHATLLCLIIPRNSSQDIYEHKKASAASASSITRFMYLSSFS